MKEKVKEFCLKIGITENQFYGKEKISGDLYLSSLTSIPESFNPTVGGGLDLSSLTSIPESFNPTVGGYLYLSSLTSIPESFNPTVGGDLYLSSLTSIPESFNPTVGGDLYLRSLTSIPESFNPTVGGGLDLSSLTSIPESFNPTVGGGLYLSSLTSIPESFNPTVGGYLDLRSLTSIPESFNPTVGGYLDLSSLTSIPESFNPTVGGGLYLRKNTKYIGAKVDIPKIPKPNLEWQNGKYICKDGILTEVISNRGNVYRIRKIAKKEIEYLITDGNGNWAHGETLEEAKEDLIYKVSDRRKSDYENLTLDSILTHEEAVKCYRVITGACSFGTRNFVENRLKERKEKYTISEMIELTKGEYGHESFKKFFN